MCKFMCLQYNNLLSKDFAGFYNLVLKSHSYNTQNASNKNLYISKSNIFRRQLSYQYLRAKIVE